MRRVLIVGGLALGVFACTQQAPEQAANEARYNALRERQRLSLVTDPATGMYAGPVLTHDECMFVNTWTPDGTNNGDRWIANDRCAPATYRNEPPPVPVYIVPRP
jgi:hypothetical protein